MGKKKAKVEIAEYRMSVNFAVCLDAIDVLYEIRIADKTAWSGAQVGNATLNVSNINLFGGNKKEGGVDGHVYVMTGHAAQTTPSFIAAKLGRTPSTMSGGRGFTQLWFTNRSGGRKGFYWQANSPYLPDVKVKLARWPKINTGKSSLYFVLDYSNSMSGDRIASLKAAMASVFTSLQSELLAGRTFDIGVTRFNTAAATLERTDVDSGDIDDLAAFVAGAAVSGGTDFTDAIAPAITWFDASLGDAAVTQRSLFFVTDGAASATTAAANAADLVDRASGDFNTADGTAVRIFGINIESGATAEIAKLDNTPEDGVPVVSGADIAGLTDALARALFPGRIGADANPAYIILEHYLSGLLTCQLSPAQIDLDSFEDAAVTLYGEGLGLSFSSLQPAETGDVVEDVLTHIDGLVYPDRRTGLLTLKLIRDDYDAGALREIDPSNADLISFRRRGDGETVSKIDVTWTDPLTEEDAATPAIEDLARTSSQGASRPDSRNFWMVRSEALALKLGHRELLAASAPIAFAELELDRTHWDIAPGEAVKLSWPERSIASLICRVDPEVDYGGPDDETIRVKLYEDVFGLDLAEFASPPASAWEDESEQPSAADNAHVMTLPYYFIANEVDAAAAADAADPDVFAGVLAAEGGNDCAQYDLYTEEADALGNLDFVDAGRKTIIARGVLTEAWDAEAQTSISAFPALTQGPVPEDGAFILIGDGDDDENELAIISDASPSASPPSYAIERGVLDTTPKAWPIGTPFWIITEGAIFADDTVRASGGDADYKILTITSLGRLAEASAPVVTETLNSRPYLPLRPANVKVNAVAFSDLANPVNAVGGGVEVTAATRNRLTEDAIVQLWTAGAVTPEDGQTVTVTVMDLSRNVLAVNDDVTLPYTVPPGNYAGYAFIIVRTTSKRSDGASPATVYESLQGHEHLVQVADTALELQNGEFITLQNGINIELNG